MPAFVWIAMSVFSCLRVVALVAAALSASPAANAREWRTLRIGSEGAHPPFNYLDQMGQLQGFDIDIARAVCARIKADCEFMTQDFAGLLPALVAGRFDAVFSSMTVTEERQKFALFTNKYYGTRLMFVANRAKPIASTEAANAKGLRIGAKAASTSSRLLRDVYAPAGAEVRLFVTQDEARVALARGQLDLVIGDKAPLLDWLEKSPTAQCCEVTGADITSPRYVGGGVGAAVRKSDGELKTLIDGALAELRASGAYDTIRRKYFSFDPF